MNPPFTLQRTLQFSVAAKGRKVLSTVALAPATAAERPAGRTPRLARLLALALHFEELVGSGSVADYAELARHHGVSRARISQVMNLTLLAVDIQEQVLFLPRIQRGRDPIHLRQLQTIALEADWRKQRRLWQALLSRNWPAALSSGESAENCLDLPAASR